MRVPVYTALGSICAAVAVLAWPALARADCTPEQIQRFGAAAAADRWALRQGEELTPAARARIALEFCEAAASVEASRHVDDAAIAAKADDVIASHLRDVLDPGHTPRSMTAELASAFGTAGLSRPVAREFERVSIDYQGAPDQARIDGELRAVKPAVVAPLGRVVVEGLKAGRSVCSGTDDVVAGKTLTIHCVAVH